MKYYHMIIEPKIYFEGSKESKVHRKEYISTHQGKAPDGWQCVGVFGYHEEVKN